MRSLAETQHAPVRTFLIADIRGYAGFTAEHGDEAAALLVARFSDIVKEGVQLRGGRLIEIRGDEALAVFESARQAIHLEVVEFLTKPASLGDLERALDRAVRKLSAAPPVIPPEMLNDDEDDDESSGIDVPTDAPAGAAGKTLEEVERQHILAALARNAGNRTATALELGISRRTLYYKLEEYQKQGFGVE